MSNEDIINDTVKAGIEAFLKSDDEPKEEKKDEPKEEKKDDVKELPENKAPENETPEDVVPEEAPAEGDLAKKYLGKDLKSASDDEIATLLTNTIAALGF